MRIQNDKPIGYSTAGIERDEKISGEIFRALLIMIGTFIMAYALGHATAKDSIIAGEVFENQGRQYVTAEMVNGKVMLDRYDYDARTGTWTRKNR
jgi:hypothetical protein